MYHNPNKNRDTLCMALFMHLVAFGYLCIVQFKLVDTNRLNWDSNLGLMMLTIPTMLISYAWIMLIMHWTKWDRYFSAHELDQHPVNHKVIEKDGDWSAKDVHW